MSFASPSVRPSGRPAGLSSRAFVQPVVLYVDYENLRYSASHAFGSEITEVNPVLLGELIVSRRERASVLTEVRVYRGEPSFELDQVRAIRQFEWASRMAKDSRFVFVTRPMKYLGGRPREKGIDVALALDLVLHSISSPEAAAVVVSRDSDFQPALEAFIRISTAADSLEVASFEGLSRLHGPIRHHPWCHVLSREDFEAIRDEASRD